jgi:hypothetical protein
MKAHQSVACLLAVPLLVMLAPAVRGAQAPESQPAIKVIGTFENIKDIDLERGAWHSNTGGGISRQHATDGQQSLWTAFSRADAVLASTASGLPNDWSGYEKLCIDAFVEGAPVALTITLTDRNGNRYRVPHYYVRAGANTIEVNLAGAAAAAPEALDLAHVVGLAFLCERAPERQNTTFVDNIRLTRGLGDLIPTELANMPEIPVVAGNLVANPGFEYGVTAWQFWGYFDWGEYRVGTAGTADAHTGSSCATITSVGYKPGRGGLATDRIWAPRGGDYQVKLFVKGTGGAEFRLGVANGTVEGDPKDLKVSPEWQELTYQVSLIDERQPVRLWLYNVRMGTLFLDDVSLTPVGAVAQAASESMLQGLTDVRLSGSVIYVNGEPFYPRGVLGSDEPDTDLANTPLNLVLAPVLAGNPRPFLDRCAKASVFAVANASESVAAHAPTSITTTIKVVEKHPAVIGYLLADEPDGEAHPVPPGELRLARQTLKKGGVSLPTVLRLEGRSPSCVYQFGGLSDVLLVSASAVRAARPFDLTNVTTPLDRAKALLRGKVPIWVVLDVRGAGPVEAEPAELTAMAYVAVTHGADGVLWEPFSYIKARPAFGDAIRTTADELRQLTPALTSPVVSVITGAKWVSKATESKTSLHGTSRQYQDQLYLIIVNISQEAQPATTFTLTRVAPTAPVEVLFENRSLTLEGGVLTDDFAPYARHVYRLHAPAETPATPASGAPPSTSPPATTAPAATSPPTPAP